jgi:hypothetical protein
MEPSCVSGVVRSGLSKALFFEDVCRKETRKTDCCLEVDATPSFVTDAVHVFTAKERQLTPEVQVNA